MRPSVCGLRFITTRFEVRGGWGWAHLVAHTCIPVSSLLTHSLSLTVFWLSGFKSVSVRPSDPDTITNTALEAALRRGANLHNDVI